jgi:hypothetical protein
MTLPDERYRAVMRARELMYALMDPKKTPGVPKTVREQARGVLRHYPSDWDMDRASEASPDVFQKQMEAVTRLFQQYEESKRNDGS